MINVRGRRLMKAMALNSTPSPRSLNGKQKNLDLHCIPVSTTNENKPLLNSVVIKPDRQSEWGRTGRGAASVPHFDVTRLQANTYCNLRDARRPG